MAAAPYTIFSYEHQSGFTVAPLQLDTTDTALALPGKDYSGWGQSYSQNFVDLLEHFSRGEPGIKSTGMLWYDAVNNVLKVWNGSSWKPTNQFSQPRNIALGGMVTGSAAFDGSSDITIQATLAASGVAPGNYVSANITVDQYGRITSAGNGFVANANQTEVNSFNTRVGDVTLTSQDVINALGYTPGNASSGTTITASQIDSALGYTPANDALVVHKAGDTMSGTLNMNNHSVTGLPNGSNASDAVNLAQLQFIAAIRTQRIFNGEGITPGTTAQTIYAVTVSPNAPSGGNDGDVWYRY